MLLEEYSRSVLEVTGLLHCGCKRDLARLSELD